MLSKAGPALAAGFALFGCATGAPPRVAPSAREVVHDARSGLRLEVPEGWQIAPRAMVEATRPLDPRLAPRHLFTLLDDDYLLALDGNQFLGIALPLRLEQEALDADAFCRFFAQDVDVNLDQVVVEEILRIDQHDVCAIRAAQPDSRPARYWVTRTRDELLMMNAFERGSGSGTPIEHVADGLRFVAPGDPEPEPPAPEPVVLRDARTGLRFTVPRGWWLVPEGVRRQVAMKAGLDLPLQEDWSFTILRSNALPGPESLTYTVEGRAPELERSDAGDAACAQLLELDRELQPDVQPLPSREIAGRSFCGSRIVIGGVAQQIYSAAIGGHVARFRLSALDEQVAGLEALLDDVEFE